MGAVGLTSDLQDRRPIHQAIEKRCRQRRVPQVIGPGLELDIRRQGGGMPARAGVEQAIVERAGLRLGGAFPAVEAEFIGTGKGQML